MKTKDSIKKKLKRFKKMSLQFLFEHEQSKSEYKKDLWWERHIDIEKEIALLKWVLK